MKRENSTRFSRYSEAFASEFLENLEEMFHRLLMDVIGSNIQLHSSVPSVHKVLTYSNIVEHRKTRVFQKSSWKILKNVTSLMIVVEDHGK